MIIKNKRSSDLDLGFNEASEETSISSEYLRFWV